MCLACLDDSEYTDVDRTYLRELCDQVVIRRRPRVRGVLQGMKNWLSGKPATLGFFWERGLNRAIRELTKSRRFEAVVVFSSAMAQYAETLPIPVKVIDIADVVVFTISPSTYI